METVGVFTPETSAEVRERYAAVSPAAQGVVREIARAMEFDAEEYDRRVTSAVVETARDALFASLLEVHVGSRAEFEDWCAAHEAYEVTPTGSPNVERVAWHPAPATETVVATTYQAEREAAIDTLRRQAWGEVYRPLVEEAE